MVYICSYTEPSCVMDSGGPQPCDVEVNKDSEATATQEWEQLKEDGRKFCQDSQWPKAIECYTKAIALNPTAAVLYSNRALCQLRLSKFARATEDAENAIRFEPNVVKYYRTLSQALQGLKLFQESAEVCKAGLQVDPSDEVLLSRLMEARTGPNRGTAGNASQEHVYWRYLNRSSLHNGKDKKLGQEWENCFPPIDSPRGNIVVRDDVSLNSTLSDLATRAEQGSVAALKYFNAHKFMEEATYHALNGPDVRKAFRCFRKAMKLWDGVPVVDRVCMKFHEMAEEALKKNPNDVDALYVLMCSEFCRVGRDYRVILPIAKKGAMLDPNVPEFHVMLGYVHGHLGEYEDAMVSFDRALELERDPEVLFSKGDLYLCNKREREGIEALQQYVEASQKDELNVPLACYLLAYLFLKMGDEEKARKFWDKGQEFERYTIKMPLPAREKYDLKCQEYKAGVQLVLEMLKDRAGVVRRRSGGSTSHNGDDNDMTCGECRKKTETTLSLCSRCGKMRYCGRECQRKHWPIHKKSCVKK